MKSLETYYNDILAVGKLSFSNRHHLWIRHIQIGLELDLEKCCIIAHFKGSCIDFQSYTLRPTQNKTSADAFLSKETLEDYLAQKFLSMNGFFIKIDDFSNGDCAYKVGQFNYVLGLQQFVKTDYLFTTDANKS